MNLLKELKERLETSGANVKVVIVEPDFETDWSELNWPSSGTNQQWFPLFVKQFHERIRKAKEEFDIYQVTKHTRLGLNTPKDTAEVQVLLQDSSSGTDLKYKIHVMPTGRLLVLQ